MWVIETKYNEGVHRIYLLAGGGIRGLQCQATQQGTEACTSTNAACIIDIVTCCCHPRRYGRWSCIGCCGGGGLDIDDRLGNTLYYSGGRRSVWCIGVVERRRVDGQFGRWVQPGNMIGVQEALPVDGRMSHHRCRDCLCR